MPLRRFIVGVIGIVLLLMGVLPSNPLLFPQRFDPPYSYITISEAIWILSGLLVIAFSLLPYIRQKLVYRPSHTAGIVGWAILLALPYFATWFYSYSYHYRLGFAIVPLLILPTAILLSKWLTVERITRWSDRVKVSYAIILVLLSLPGIIAVTIDVTWSRVWLLDDTLDTDIRKYQVTNPDIMEIYFGINEFMAETETEPIIVAPVNNAYPSFSTNGHP